MPYNIPNTKERMKRQAAQKQADKKSPPAAAVKGKGFKATVPVKMKGSKKG